MSEVPVRVFLRVRPLLESEAVYSTDECIQLVSNDQLLLGQDRSFRFDRVFSPEASQTALYEHCVSPLVSDCLQGYNATVFAYGQTGSGKSFTMGSETSIGYESEQRGMIPRALEAIFQYISNIPDTSFTVCVSYIELYKEELRDLLVEGSYVSSRGGGLAETGERGIYIREDAQGNTLVLGSTELNVSSTEEALGWLEAGNSSRVTGATQMNQKSSRSHAIFTIHFRQSWKETGRATLEPPPLLGDNPAINNFGTGMESPSGEIEQCLSAKFHFVDLAGSERVSKTGNRGERFKESVHINSGLLALGNVISALGVGRRKSSHVPYRDSKITRLLKDSLGGNARTVMITCLSPAAVNFGESLNSLKYAQRARKICNRPVVNRDPHTNRIHQMQEEIQSLKDELQKVQLNSKPVSTAATIVTVDSSLTTEPLDILSRISELEQELKKSREQCTLYQTSLDWVRDEVNRLFVSSVESGSGCSVEQLQKLHKWLKHLKAFEEVDVDASSSLSGACENSGSSLFSAKALQIIEELRSELEHCHSDLQTDEELFAEKMDEMSELRLSCNELLAEKERLEEMWLVAQETEGLLRQQLAQVLEKLSSMEAELISRDEIIVMQKQLLEGLPRNESNQLGAAVQSNVGSETHEQSKTHQTNVTCSSKAIALDKSGDALEKVGGKLVEKTSGDPLVSDPVGFSANRSLLVGKVKTSSIEDFTEEAVLKSLRCLTQCLIDGRNHPPQGTPPTLTEPTTSLENGSAVSEGKPDHSLRPSESDRGFAHPAEQAVAEQTSRHSQATKLNSTTRTTLGDSRKNIDRFETASKNEGGLICDHPAIPVEISLEEPRYSKTSHPLHAVPLDKSASCNGVRNVWGVESVAGACVGSVAGACVMEMDVLNESTLESKKQLTSADEKLTQAQDELNNLTLKIKLKEELIRELVKTSKSTKQINMSCQKKIHRLEQEVLTVTSELNKTWTTLRKANQQSSSHSDVSLEIRKTMEDQKRKLANAERKLAALQKKQKETQRLVQFGVRREQRVDELESGIGRLRNKQELLKRKLKTQADKKIKLENDLQKYQYRMKMLQTHTDQQSKVLKVKTEEAAVAQRKLRQLSGKTPSSQRTGENSSWSQWLDMEVEKVLKQKQALEALERSLAERERVILEKEVLISERDALTVKQLQASQTTARDIVHLSLQIDSVEASLKTREREVASSEPGSSNLGKQIEITTLKKERDDFVRECQKLQTRMDRENFLPLEDQRKLCEINEHIEILEATLDYKNTSIDSTQPNTIVQEDVTFMSNLKSKLKQLPSTDAHRLLERYVDRVIQLQLLDQQTERSKRKLEVEVCDQAKVIGKLERSLKQATAAGERQLLSLQKEHELQIQLLVQQLAAQDCQPDGPSYSTSIVDSDHQHIHSLQSKVKHLEKDLYYYKKTSRDLRKKLQGETTTSKNTDISNQKLERLPESTICESTVVLAHKLSHTASLSEQLDKPQATSTVVLAHQIAHAHLSAMDGKVKSTIVRTPSKETCENLGDSLDAGVGVVSGNGDVAKDKERMVTRKHKKQLRQLSAKEVAERKGSIHSRSPY